MARFDDLGQAKSAYFYAQKLRTVEQANQQDLQLACDQLDRLRIAEGSRAEDARDKYLFKLGQAVISFDEPKAMQAWSLSNHPEAAERWIRHAYKQGQKVLVEDRLRHLIEEPESEQLLVFAEDFLARKFGNKRTSVLTDMLRGAGQRLQIDELYLNSVESGVQDYYGARGIQAFKTENRLWRALFGLTFWHELFELDPAALANEFDSRPRVLKQNSFYREFGAEIEARLDDLPDADRMLQYLSKMATKHYGKNNGIFIWQSDLLEILASLISHAPMPALQAHLRAMCRDYKLLRDGYPDLMVLEDGQLRFEEIKAPGDQLRKNQLLSIRYLRKAGFDVCITSVEWFIDPNQPYVVVDVETTGGTAEHHRITEIGMVKVINGEVVDTWQSLINPQRHIPKFITNLTGIDNQMVAQAPPFADIADTLRTFMEGCVFVAHNVNFDYGFFRREFERLDQSFRMPKLCTVREMRKAVPGLKSYSLGNLAQHFGIDMQRHHRAMSDAQAAAELLMIINEHRLAAS